MYLCYFDESGDDGFPNYSSEQFVLTALYFRATSWKDNFLQLYEFRKSLKSKYNFPVKEEFHTRAFIQDKKPYHGLYNNEIRKEILFTYFSFISKLDLKIINVVINKTKISGQSYDVLDNSLTFAIQRIENDMLFSLLKTHYLIITDEGRVLKMTRTTRKIQKVNFIPSIFGSPYRKEIKYLIEDPLPKKSQESYFIQVSDMISYVVNLYVTRNYTSPVRNWPKRVLNVLQYGEEEKLLQSIKNVLNTKASKNDRYGIVIYPR